MPAGLHDRIERGFERWGRMVARRPWPVVGLALLLTLGLGLFIPRIQGDFSNESYLGEGVDARVVYDAFREQFGRDDRILVGVHPPAIFDRGFLTRLEALHRALERELPYVEEVQSLVNARWTRGEGDRLIVEDLMPRVPRSEAELRALEERVRANPLYVNALISRDADFTVLSIKPFTYSPGQAAGAGLGGFEDTANAAGEPEFLTIPEQEELVARLDELIARHRAPGFPLHAVGSSVLGSRMRAAATHDATLFVSAALLTIGAVLFALFRRISGVILPLTVIGMSLVATAGCMAALGIPFSIVTQIVPTFLIAIGVCDAVHLLAITYRRLSAGDPPADAMVYALRHSGFAVVMTSLTTAGGLSSFAVAEIAPVANLGLLSPLGVLLALLYTLTLLPALLVIVPLGPGRSVGAPDRPPRLDRLLAGVGELGTGHPRLVLALTAGVLLVGLAGVLQLRFAHHIIENLPAGHPQRVAAELVDREFEGSSTVEVLVDSGHEDGLHEPALLAALDAAAARAQASFDGPVRVGSSLSLADLVKEIHQALNEGRAEMRVLPGERALIAQELLLFEQSGSDDLEDFTDSTRQHTRLTLRVPLVDGLLYVPFLERLEALVAHALPAGTEFAITGSTALYARTFLAVITSLTRSYVLALLIITPLMILLIGRFRLGLLAMVPNLIPVFMTLGFMGWLGISLNFSTLLVGSIVIGVAVDDTIHFMHQFNRSHRRSGDVAAAVRETLLSTGSALLVTSLVLALGFGLFAFGTITGTVAFGLLTAFATLVAFVADVLVAPALLSVALGRAR